ncbi:MAG: DUF4388 domain-containing protein [Planctomycetota bacterium]|nr:MAG: DUF4388 domain-containing protein [Planctomycetota bacterium]
MAFSGTVSAMGLDEVIAFLAHNGLEGVLTVAGAAVSFQLYVHEGRILFPYASANTPHGRLPREALDDLRRRAEALGRARPRPDERGRVPPCALARILARSATLPPRRARSASGRLGAEVLDDLFQRAEALSEERRRAQLEADIHELFSWDEARFRFCPRRLPTELVQTLEAGDALVLDPEALLMEVARRSDERRRGRAQERPRSSTRVTVRPARARARRDEEDAARLVRGDLDGFGLAALCQSLRTRRRTGTLEVRAEGRTERIYFHRGEAFALSREHEDEAFVRDFLGESGELAVTDLARASVAEAELSTAQQDALKERFFDVLLWEGATFCFRRGELPLELFVPGRGTTRVALETERFLVQAIGRLSEWEELRSLLGGADAVLRFRSHREKMTCVREVADYLTLVDGGRSFSDLVRRTGVDRLEAARVCAGLLRAGVLEVAPPSTPRSGTENGPLGPARAHSLRARAPEDTPPPLSRPRRSSLPRTRQATARPSPSPTPSRRSATGGRPCAPAERPPPR